MFDRPKEVCVRRHVYVNAGFCPGTWKRVLKPLCVCRPGRIGQAFILLQTTWLGLMPRSPVAHWAQSPAIYLWMPLHNSPLEPLTMQSLRSSNYCHYPHWDHSKRTILHNECQGLWALETSGKLWAILYPVHHASDNFSVDYKQDWCKKFKALLDKGMFIRTKQAKGA